MSLCLPVSHGRCHCSGRTAGTVPWAERGPAGPCAARLQVLSPCLPRATIPGPPLRDTPAICTRQAKLFWFCVTRWITNDWNFFPYKWCPWEQLSELVYTTVNETWSLDQMVDFNSKFILYMTVSTPLMEAYVHWVLWFCQCPSCHYSSFLTQYQEDVWNLGCIARDYPGSPSEGTGALPGSAEPGGSCPGTSWANSWGPSWGMGTWWQQPQSTRGAVNPPSASHSPGAEQQVRRVTRLAHPGYKIPKCKAKMRARIWLCAVFAFVWKCHAEMSQKAIGCEGEDGKARVTKPFFFCPSGQYTQMQSKFNEITSRWFCAVTAFRFVIPSGGGKDLLIHYAALLCLALLPSAPPTPASISSLLLLRYSLMPMAFAWKQECCVITSHWVYS